MIARSSAVIIRIIYGMILVVLMMANAIAGEMAERKYLSVDLSQQGIAVLQLEKDLKTEATDVKYRRLELDSEEKSDDWDEKEAITANKVTLSGSGTYEVQFYKTTDGKISGVNEEILWKQRIYIPYPKPDNIEELAQQYLPLAVYHETEEYFPISLNDMLDFGANDGESLSFEHLKTVHDDSGKVTGLNYESGRVKMGEEIKTFMSFNGHSDMNINFTTAESVCEEQPDGTCVYGKLEFTDGIETTKLFLRDAKGSIKDAHVYYDAQLDDDNNLFLTYYYFYAFDPKNATDVSAPAMVAHAFDRESVIIKFSFDQEEKKYIPEQVIYSGHLAKQLMEFKGCDSHDKCSEVAQFNGEEATLTSWTGGKTMLSWDSALKVGKHPVIYKAQGSHAIFPTYGFYKVRNDFPGTNWTLENKGSLTEMAGGTDNSQLLLPENINLHPLDFVTDSFLAFSGDWVDMRFTSDGAKFPPFIRSPYSDYSQDADTSFESCLSGYGFSNNCDAIKEYFTAVRGLQKYRPATVRVVDAETGDLLPYSVVTLTSNYDETFYQVGSDAQHTFLFEEVDGNEYRVSVRSSGYSDDEDCISFTGNTDFEITNFTESQVVICEMTKIAPIANAGDDQFIAEGEMVNLDGRASSAYGSIEKYEWSEEGVDLFIAPQVSSPNFEVGSHHLTLRIVDDLGEEATDDVVILIYDQESDIDNDHMPDAWEVTNKLDPYSNDASLDSDRDGRSNQQEYLDETDPNVRDDAPSIPDETPENKLPVANAGDDQIIAGLMTAMLDGSASTDVEDDDAQTPLTYSWIQTDSTGFDIILLDETDITPVFTTPDINEETVLTFELTVTDSQLASSTDTVLIKVKPNSTIDDNLTKLDANGNALATSASDWSCVQDNATGLIWEVKTDDGSLQDKNHRYSWYNSTGINNGGSAGSANGGICVDSENCDTEKYVSQVNLQYLCGENDWRLPDREELLSIVVNNDYPNTVDYNYFPNTQSSYYWSSTPVNNNYDMAWNIDFSEPPYDFYSDLVGYYLAYYKNSNSYVRLVRKIATDVDDATADISSLTVAECTDKTIDQSFQTNNWTTSLTEWNDVVLACIPILSGIDVDDSTTDVDDSTTDVGGVYNDSLNMLIWQDDARVKEKSTWTDAEEMCSVLNNEIFSGYTDWRLPTLTEIESLFDAYPLSWPERESQLINYEIDEYWYNRASTENYGFVYNFSGGYPSLTYTLSAYTRCVRTSI